MAKTILNFHFDYLKPSLMVPSLHKKSASFHFQLAPSVLSSETSGGGRRGTRSPPSGREYSRPKYSARQCFFYLSSGSLNLKLYPNEHFPTLSVCRRRGQRWALRRGVHRLCHHLRGLGQEGNGDLGTWPSVCLNLLHTEPEPASHHV